MPLHRSSPPNLDALVSGKRRAPRRAVALHVRVKGAHREFEAVARDLSAGGARVELDPKAIVDEHGAVLPPAEQFAFLERHFGESFDIEFRDALVVVEAHLKRMALETDAAGTFGLGCEFAHALTVRQQRALGLIEVDGGQEETPWEVAVGLHDVDREADPARPVTALLLDDVAVVGGPLFLGAVTAIGARALAIRLEGLACEEAAERLSNANLRLRLVRGSEPLFESKTVFVAARYMDGARPGSDVLLSVPTRLPRPVRKVFRRVG